MPQVHVELQEGFSADHVVVHIGELRFDLESVTTRAMIGFAEAVSAPVPGGRATVRVDLPAPGLAETVEIHADDDAHVGVSRIGERLVPIVSAEPFHYL